MWWSSIAPGVHGQPALIMERFPALPADSLDDTQRSDLLRWSGSFIARLAQLSPADDLPVSGDPAKDPLAAWYQDTERLSLEHFADRADIVPSGTGSAIASGRWPG